MWPAIRWCLFFTSRSPLSLALRPLTLRGIFTARVPLLKSAETGLAAALGSTSASGQVGRSGDGGFFAVARRSVGAVRWRNDERAKNSGGCARLRAA